MAEIKYVAAGFLNDADRLLQNFVSENSMEFSVFAEIWKRHNFSLIYALRPKGKELREFTLEIFQLSMNFLKSNSVLYQVGGTFLLYALYRNQVLSPPLKIRITSNQFKTILALSDVSRSENNPSLHYVINYLIKHSFNFVACPMLKGPNSTRNEVRKDTDKFHLKIQESDEKPELTEISSMLSELDCLFTQYKETVLSLNTPFVDSAIEHPSFKDFALRIGDLLNGNKIKDQDTCTRPKDSTIGSRRAVIKAAAFSHPVSHYLSHDENGAVTSGVSEDIESSGETPSKPPVPVSAVRKKRRVRRGVRKAGRPRKLASEDSMSEKELQPNLDESLQEKGLSGRRLRRPRGSQFAKIRHYYAENFAECDDLNVPSTSNSFPSKEYLFSSESDGSEQLENLSILI